MRNNKILIIGLIGALSTIPSEFLTQIFKLLGIVKYSIFGLSSLLITGNRPSIILGAIVDTVIAAISAILIYYIIRRLKQNNFFAICIVSSILMWIALETILKIFFEGNMIPMRPMSAYYGHLVSAIIFGITEAILFKMFLFKKARSIE